MAILMSFLYFFFAIVDSVRYTGRSLFESNFVLRMRMVKGDFAHRCHSEYVHVHSIFGLLHQSLHTEAPKGTQ